MAILLERKRTISPITTPIYVYNFSKNIKKYKQLFLRVMLQDLTAFEIPSQRAVDLRILSGNFFR